MHELLGDIAMMSGDAASAATSYERASMIDAEAPMVGGKLVAALFDSGEYQKCLDTVRRHRQKAQSEDTSGKRFVPTIEMLRYEGRSLAMLGRVGEARVVFSDTVREYPENVGGWRDLATAALALGDVGRAQNASERLIALASEDPAGYTLRGYVAERKGNFDDAIAWHRSACERGPRNAEAHIALGMALAHAGRKSEAMKMLEKALSLDPSSDLAKEAIAGVSQE